ncbi:MAG: hypothetical protein Q8N13_06355 [Acidovorax sp.]|nr:hypothetical protein [Acidovorax sp.]
MLTSDLFSSLVYLDRDFIAGIYEITTGLSPQSQITKAQSKKAGASIPVFSAEISAVETRTFPVSTLEMLACTMPALQAEPSLDAGDFEPGMSSKVGWVDATLGTVTAFSSYGVPGEPGYMKGEEQGCFTLRGNMSLTLITTPDYFVSGLDALLKMHKVLLRDLTIPVRALVRVVAAQNYTDDWIAVPYLICERRTG